MIHLMFISATIASGYLITINSTLTPVVSDKPQKSPFTSSLTTWIVTNTTVLIPSRIPLNASPDGKVLNHSNITDEDRKRYLERLQEEATLNLIPTLIFLSVIVVVGLFGNTMVLLVYSKKAYRSATDIFIMAVAVSDLVANIFAIPGEIYDLFYIWDLKMPLLCKCRVYINALTTLMSAELLLALAVCRYRKICTPFGKQISTKNAKIICGGIAMASCLCSIPNAIVYGAQTIPTRKPEISGSICFTDDEYRYTIWPMMYNGFLMLLFFACCIPLIVLYVLIGVQAWRHSAIHGIHVKQSTPATSNNTMSDTLDSANDMDEKSKIWRFFRHKKTTKFEAATGNTCLKEDIGKDKRAEIPQKQTKIIEQNPCRKVSEETSVEEVDGDDTKLIRLPFKVKSPTDSPTCEHFNLNRIQIRDRDINADEMKNTDKMFEKPKNKTVDERTTLKEFSKANEKAQVLKDGSIDNEEDLSDKNHCDDFATLGVSHQKILQQRQGDTLNETGETGKKTVAVNELENPTDVTKATMATVTGCGDNHIKFNLTITKTDGDVESHKGLKSCNQRSPLNSPSTSKSDESKSNPQRRGLTRTTLMLFIISATNIIAYVPYLLLMALKYLVPDFRENLNDEEFAVYNVFLRFYFLNSATNAIIYSLCDIRFRNKAKKIMLCKT